jgi:hypothetical protein
MTLKNIEKIKNYPIMSLDKCWDLMDKNPGTSVNRWCLTAKS